MTIDSAMTTTSERPEGVATQDRGVHPLSILYGVPSADHENNSRHFLVRCLVFSRLF
jgi:hypothetical protein